MIGRFQVTVYVNVSDDGMFFLEGLRPRDPIAEVGTWEVYDDTPEAAAGTMWVVGNKEEESIGWLERRYPRDVRSVSVGDMFKIVDDDGKQTFLAVESIGWREVIEPTNPVVPIEGTHATSRKAQ
jgi:hypothetical protein